MSARQLAIVIDAADPDALRDFWVAAMRYRPHGEAGAYRSATPPAGETGPKLVFQQVDDPPTPIKNRLHIDIVVGDEIDDETNRLLALGATRLSDRIDEVGTSWIVFADPEGNEFCLEVERIGEALPNLAARHSQWIRGGISGMKRSGATSPLILLVYNT